MGYWPIFTDFQKHYLKLQLSLGLLLCLIFACLDWKSSVTACLLGILTGLVPDLILMKITFRNFKHSKQLVGQFYRGEMTKFVTTLVLFTIIFLGAKLKPVPFFLGLMGTKLLFLVFLVWQPKGYSLRRYE